MSLLHREDSRDGGGSQENRPSLREINAEASQLSGNAAAPKANPFNGQECGGWRWEQPRSPEAAQSPRALVPAPCFPPRGDSDAFTSCSELGSPGACSSESCQEMADLMQESFESFGQECGGWRWEQPRSPEAAQSPRALVPAPCFPPRGDPDAFTSRSEQASPGACSSEPYQGMADLVEADLVESFSALEVTSRPLHSAAAARPHYSAALARLHYERTTFNSESSWQTEDVPCEPQAGRVLIRRASSGTAEREGDTLLTWSGILPPRCTDANPPGGFALKLFMGGLPWDISKDGLLNAFREFKPLSVEWPGRHTTPRGFAYITLMSERHVHMLLNASRRVGTKWFYHVTWRSERGKDVELIPWAVSDSNWVVDESAREPVYLRLEPSLTVFVGALHGIISAPALARIMDDLFSDVVYAGIDIDKYKYPIGSGRVTFSSKCSYLSAVSARHVVIHTRKIAKKIQLDPYLQDAMCSVCNLRQGPYFCRESACLRYFCRTCWVWQHPSGNHKALMRHHKSVTFIKEYSSNSSGQSQPAGERAPRRPRAGGQPRERTTLNTVQLATLNTVQLATLNTVQLATLNTVQLATLNTVQLATLNTVQLATLNAVATLNTVQLATLNAVQLATLNAVQLATLNAVQLATLNAVQLATLNAVQLATLNAVQLATLNAVQLATLNAVQLATLNAVQLATLNTVQLATLNTVQLATLNTVQPSSELP